MEKQKGSEFHSKASSLLRNQGLQGVQLCTRLRFLICVQTSTKDLTGYTCSFPMTREPEVYVKPWVMTELARKAPQLPPTGDLQVVVWRTGEPL